tara:strand:+ start:133607 stop:134581 length:975 start_codon:yes stop_codon:yes gene_type:complete
MSCVDTKGSIDIIAPAEDLNVIDKEFIFDSAYSKGDVRRYGIFPNKAVSGKHLNDVLYLANQGLPIQFPKGYYDTSIVLKKSSNISLHFDEVILGGGFQIIDENGENSQYIKITGTLTILDKLFIRRSNNISFDDVFLMSDTIQNMHRQKNRGVSIYAGSKNIRFNSLTINDTGGEPKEFFKYTAAALQVHGWKNNPENILINSLSINNAGRTALYLTGNNHQINKVQVFNFGLGSNENMFGLDDASPGEETEFSAVWINRCNSCEIDSLVINSIYNKGRYSLRLDEGKYHEPTFINNIRISNKAKKLLIKDDKLTNILVKHEY